MSVRNVLEQVAEDMVGTQPPLEPELAALAVVAGSVVVATPALWRIARHLLTIVHEGGHAVAALVSGRRLSGIRLHADTSGLTVSHGRSRGPGMVLTAFAGYPAPAAVGLGGAALVSLDRGLLALWGALLVLTLLLLQIRNFYGLYVVLVAAVLLTSVTWWGNPEVQGVAAWGLASFLLLGAPRAVVELQLARRRSRGRTSDADVLARITPLPAIVWVGLMLLLTVGCAAAGGFLLVVR